jgi:hypothetical protein
MADNKNIVEKKNKDQINEIIEREANMSISEATKVLFPNSKQTYYNNAKIRPLKGKFISLVKSKLNVDLSRFGIQESNGNNEVERLRKEIEQAKNIIYNLNIEIEELKKKGN